MSPRDTHNSLPLRAFPQLKSFILLGLLTLPIFFCVLSAHAQRGESALVNQAPQGIGVEEIIRRFAAKEKDFQAARAHYTYRQSNIIQTLEGNTADGEYRQDWDVNFDTHGK